MASEVLGIRSINSKFTKVEIVNNESLFSK